MNIFLDADFRVHFDRLLGAELLRLTRKSRNFRLKVHYGGPADLEKKLEATNFRVDLILGLYRNDASILQAQTLGIPVVNMSSFVGTSPMHRVCNDDAAIGKVAAECFYNRGFRHFCAIPFGSSYYIEQVRMDAFLESAEQLGGDVHPPVRLDGKDDGNACAQALGHLPKPIALFAPTPLCAAKCIHALARDHIQVPSEAGVVTVDADEFSFGICEKEISTVQSNICQLAKESLRTARTILKRHHDPLKEKGFLTVLVPPEHVLESDTTNTFAVKHPQLQKALQWVQEDASPHLRVSELARHCGVSRRSLESLFVEHLGITAGKYLIRHRIGKAKKLLCETDFSIEEIAEMCGYADRPSFHQAFKKAAGQAPVHFRKAALR